jgi:sugar phosphate isomerase/epimerase
LFRDNDKYPKKIDIYLKREGLTLGRGNIDFDGIMNIILDNQIDTTFILEIDPIDGNQNNNTAQLEGVKALLNIQKKIIKERHEKCRAL